MSTRQKLKEIRLEAGLTPNELSENTSLSEQEIIAIEAGVRYITDQEILEWTEYCGYESVKTYVIRKPLTRPTEERWYLIRYYGESEYLKAFWINDMIGFVCEPKDTIDPYEMIAIWEIEEWKNI